MGFDLPGDRADTGVYAAAAGIAKILFVLFLVLFVVSLIMHAARGRGPIV